MEKLNKSLSFFKKSMGGIFLVVTGTFAMYYFIYRPVEAMKQQLDLDYSFKGILIGPALFVMGLYILFFTQGGMFSLQSLSAKGRKLFYIAFAIGFALGLLAWYWFSTQMTIYGYDTSKL